MYEVAEVAILLDDLQDTRQVIDACFGYFAAQDVLDAQRKFGRVRQSPMTAELERIKVRLEGILGDYFLRRHDEEAAEPEVVEEEEAEELEPLSGNPLGSKLPEGQRGQRLVPKYLQEDGETSEDDDSYNDD